MKGKGIKRGLYFGISILFLSMVTLSQAAFLNVPAEYSTVQAGIDAATSGDTVQVAAGTYTENIVLKNGVTVQGSGAETCTLQSNGTTCVVFANGITERAAIYGFTITGGAGYVLRRNFPILAEVTWDFEVEETRLTLGLTTAF